MKNAAVQNSTIETEKEKEENEISDLFLDFDPISLEQTNKQARMLSRVDHKYVVNLAQFKSFLKVLKTHYAVLEIKGLRQFTYSSCYFDDQFGCYFEHHQGRRQRFKVRTRKYVDSGDLYFEIKLKGLRGRTDKFRTGCDDLVMPVIDGKHLTMLEKLYSARYGKKMPFELRPALMVGYRRCTLVAKKGGERVTIDYRLTFANPGEEKPMVRIGNDFIIIETKSEDGRGFADETLKSLKIRQARKCSKYCIGVNLIGSVSRNNHFLPTLKKVRENLVVASTDGSPIIQPVMKSAI